MVGCLRHYKLYARKKTPSAQRAAFDVKWLPRQNLKKCATWMKHRACRILGIHARRKLSIQYPPWCSWLLVGIHFRPGIQAEPSQFQIETPSSQPQQARGF